MKKILQKINDLREAFVGWAAFVAAIVTLIGYISSLFLWGQNKLFVLIQSNSQLLWLGTISLIVMFLWIRVSKLNNRFAGRFTDNFIGDIKAKWDYVGSWRIAEPGTLIVTGSDAGGITKTGASWENYEFSFEAKIVKSCIGVVIRARDLNNYYMLQIREDMIRPHRRVEIPVVEESGNRDRKKQAPESQPHQTISFSTGWQVFDPPTPINPKLSGWFNVRVVVNGESIRLYINDEIRFQQEAFLKLPTGKVGFRNSQSEFAMVRNVRVVVNS
jgi:hypothetical protein